MMVTIRVLLAFTIALFLVGCLNSHQGIPASPIAFEANASADSLVAPMAGIPLIPEETADDIATELRGISVEATLTLAGSDTFTRSDGNTTVGDPPELLLMQPGEGEVAWAIYRYQGFAEDNLPFFLQLELADPLPGTIFIGTADYLCGAWRWQEFTPVSADLGTGIPLAWDPISPGNNTYFAIVAPGPESAALGCITLNYNTVAPPPTGLTAAQGGNGASVHLEWDLLPDTYPGIEFETIRLERASNPDGPWEMVTDLPADSTGYDDIWEPIDNPIPYATPLFYRLSDAVLGVFGPPSNAVIGWRELPRIEAINATDGAFPDRVVIDWNPVPGADGYDLEYHDLSEPGPPPFELLVHLDGGEAVLFEHSSSDPPTMPCLPGHPYEYRVRATIGPDACEEWSNTEQGYMNAAPQTTLVVTNASGPRPLEVSFDGSASFDPDGGELTFSWDWEGDGTYELVEDTGMVTHTYMDEGDFQATMQVTDDEGFDSVHWNLVQVSGWLHSWSSVGESGIGLAVDDNDNLYVAATTDYQAGSGQDGVVLKYSPDGALAWARRLSGDMDDYLVDIAVDSAGNVHAVGTTWSTGAGGQDFLLLKLAPDGALLWQKTWGTANAESAEGICRFGDKMAVCGVAFNSTHTSSGGAVLVLDASTGTVEFEKSVGATGFFSFNEIDSLIGNSDLVAVGITHQSLTDYTKSYIALLDPGNNLVMADRAFDGGFHDAFDAVVQDQSTGYFYCCGTTNSYSSSYDQLVFMFDNILNSVWGKYFGVADEYDDPSGILVSNNEVYVCGVNMPLVGRSLTLAKLNISGDITGYWVLNGSENDCDGLDVAMDSNGRLLMTGISQSAYQQVTSYPMSPVSVTVSETIPNATMSNIAGTMSGQSLTFFTPGGVIDENNSDKNAVFTASLDLTAL